MRFLILLPLAAPARAAGPVALVFDTDMGSDVDDALALGMIHDLQRRGEVRLLAVPITKDNPYPGVAVEGCRPATRSPSRTGRTGRCPTTARPGT